MQEILILDKDADCRGFLKDFLASEGYRARVADSETMFISRALSGQWLLLVMDWSFCERQDEDILSCLRTRGIKTPCLVWTGRPDCARLPDGAVMLQKPATVDQLRSKLGELIGERAEPGANPTPSGASR